MPSVVVTWTETAPALPPIRLTVTTALEPFLMTLKFGELNASRLSLSTSVNVAGLAADPTKPMGAPDKISSTVRLLLVTALSRTATAKLVLVWPGAKVRRALVLTKSAAVAVPLVATTRTATEPERSPRRTMVTRPEPAFSLTL